MSNDGHATAALFAMTYLRQMMFLMKEKETRNMENPSDNFWK
jgi:hypothetical protein